MRRASDSRPIRMAERGFTLIEMIVSIVIGGILVSLVALFGRGQIDAYLAAGDRAELSDAADTALRRVARDLQAALPNSVRNDSANFLEFVPIRDAGRYRADVGTGGAGDPLDFTDNADNSFDVLGPTVNIGAGEQLVIYNPGSEVYVGTNRRAATPGNNLSSVTFTLAGAQFPFPSPYSRFHIVGQPVTYECAANAANPAAGRVLRHTSYGFNDPQPAAFAGAQTAVLVGDVAACSFNYTPGVLQRNGLVVLRLQLTRNGESVELLHQVEVLNTP